MRFEVSCEIQGCLGVVLVEGMFSVMACAVVVCSCCQSWCCRG